MLPAVLANPVTGERVTILRSPLGGDPGPLVFTVALPPGAAGSPPHRHAVLCERFEVLAGAVEITTPQGRRSVRAGGRVAVAPGETHGFRNPGSEPATLLVEVTPGHAFERFLRAMHATAVEGRAGANGLPRDPRRLALLLLAADLHFPGAPMGLQRLVFRALAALLPGGRTGRIPNAALTGRPLPRLAP